MQSTIKQLVKKLLNVGSTLAVLTAGAALMSPAAHAGSIPPITNISQGSSFTVLFNAIGGDPVRSLPLSSTAQFTFNTFSYNTSTNRTAVQFGVNLANTASGAGVSSVLTAMGFNTTPNLVSGAPNNVSGVFDSVNTGNINVPNQGSVEFCLANNNQCGGSGNKGLASGTNSTGTGSAAATLYFSGNISSFTIDNIYVRYQSIMGVNGVTSASGSPVVPEPSTYAALLAVGGATMVWARRRKTAELNG